MTDVRALRERLDWSQTDLARFLCVADSTVARWEGDHGKAPKGAAAADLASLDNITARASGSVLKAIKDAALRGETVRTLVMRALENLGRKP